MADININAISEALNNKADRDINNLTNSGYAKGSGLGMPSSRYVDLTLGASGSTYTAPANGYFVINKTTSGTNQYVNIRNNTNGLIWENKPYSNGSYASCFLQVKRGDVVIVYYTAAGTTNVFRFIYAEGEQ